ncbi:MAG: galactokinase [Thermodesulfobacteriota bacterium]
MPQRLTQLLENEPVTSSAPCRVDMGGTLDIPAFHYALRELGPCTFNAAINLRTRVTLLPHRNGYIKISSEGFEPAEFPADSAPFSGHPLGLLFAVASYFSATGVHVKVVSESPVRAALGGSSAAAVACIAAFSRARARLDERPLSLRQIVLLAHSIESNVSRVLCGLQDQLAAAYGGVNAWFWPAPPDAISYDKREILPEKDQPEFSQSMLVAYCGVPHDSLDINGQWVDGFLAGRTRALWRAICALSLDFVEAVAAHDMAQAADIMNRECAIRQELTPGVLTTPMRKCKDAAKAAGWGARFTGAGGGGCVWALGPKEGQAEVAAQWAKIMRETENGRMLSCAVDPVGVVTDLAV